MAKTVLRMHGTLGSNPGQGTINRFHIPQVKNKRKISHATTKTQYSQINFKKNFNKAYILRHNATAHLIEYSVNIIFICNGKSKNWCDSTLL